jgi:hypothetical protein
MLINFELAISISMKIQILYLITVSYISFQVLKALNCISTSNNIIESLNFLKLKLKIITFMIKESKFKQTDCRRARAREGKVQIHLRRLGSYFHRTGWLKRRSLLYTLE